jgi:hypothetical protein
MGDRVRGGSADLTATVLNVPQDGDPFTLHVMKDGVDRASVPVTAPTTMHEFAGAGPGRYRLELRRGVIVWALTTPIWIDP